MELFKRRPLCVCCGLFLLFSYLCSHLTFKEKISVSFVILALLILLIAVALIFKMKKYGFISLIMCFIFILAALVNNFLRIDIPRINAERYIGERTAIMDIVDSEHYSEHSSSYVVSVRNINGEDASLKAILVLGFGTDELYVGDTIYANVEFHKMDTRILGQTGYQRTNREDIFIMVAVYESDDVIIERFDRNAGFFNKLFTKNGISVILEEMREAVATQLKKCLGNDAGTMANAYLTGDRSDLSADIVRDYRRAGISHLFAVSGMHVSILLGAIERLLKKLYCRKSIRCLILSVCAIGLLCLTGFSMSAMRSIFMLFMVYVAYLLSEENDSPTSLFAAVAIIILITPYAIYELGMWMSFLATLGVVTVYPVIQRAVPNLGKKKHRAQRVLFAVARACLMTTVGTVSATMFLLPVSWLIFGELSVVAIPANVIMSPLSTAFLILSALAALLADIPIINLLIRYASIAVSTLMTFFTKLFAGLDIATVSLRYPFAKWLVIISSVVLVIMLIIKISRKVLFVIPPIALTVSFCVGVLCFNAVNPAALTYQGNGHREVISISNDQSCSIIDMSDGRYARFYDAYLEATEYGATQVDSIVLTSVSSVHVSSLDYFLKNNIVRRLYLPEPHSEESRELSIRLVKIAEESGIAVKIYDGSEAIELCDDIGARVICSYNGDKRSVAVFIASGDKICGYVDAFADGSERESEVNKLISKCQTVIIGNNGVPDRVYDYEISDTAKVIYSSEKIMEQSNIKISAENTYLNKKTIFDFRILFD